MTDEEYWLSFAPHEAQLPLCPWMLEKPQQKPSPADYGSHSSRLSERSTAADSDQGNDDEGEAWDGKAPPTWGESDVTVKLVNLPRRCSEEEVLAAIDAAGFGGQYDFFVLPRGLMSKQNHGYAFLNLRAPHLMDRLREVLPGHCVRAKPLRVQPSPIQGLQSLSRQFPRSLPIN